MDNNERLVEYFKRIGLWGASADGEDGFGAEDVTKDPSKATLHKLCRVVFHHSLAVPFENYNSATGREVRVDLDGIYDKIVTRHRGGYCFEQNGLMNFVLGELGYTRRRCLGRVLLPPQPSALAHLVNIVTIDGVQYLVDVGFGGKSPRVPLKLEMDTVQIAGSEMYRFQPDVNEYVAPGGYRLQYFDWEGYAKDREAQTVKEITEYWRDQYAFSFTTVWDVDIHSANFAVNFDTRPTNIFTNSRITSLLTRFGRKTVFNEAFVQFKRISTIDFDAMRQVEGVTVFQLPYHAFEAPSEAELEGFTQTGGVLAVKSVEVALPDFFETVHREFDLDLAADGMTTHSFIPTVMAAAKPAN